MHLTLTVEQAQAIIHNRTAMIDDALLRDNCELDLMYTQLEQVGELSFPIRPYDLDKYFLNRLAYLSRATYIQKVLEKQLDTGVDYVESYSPSGNPNDDFEIWSAMIIDSEGNTDKERRISIHIEVGEEI